MALEVFSDLKQLWLLGSVGHIRAEQGCLGRTGPSPASAGAGIPPTYSGAATGPLPLRRTHHNTGHWLDRSGWALPQKALSRRWIRLVLHPFSVVVQPYRDCRP